MRELLAADERCLAHPETVDADERQASHDHLARLLAETGATAR